VQSKMFEGDLFASNPAPIYRLDPSPEVDAAWDRISGATGIPITNDELVKLGRDPNVVARFPEAWGYSEQKDGTIIAQIDVFHQIHCLNYLRREGQCISTSFSSEAAFKPVLTTNTVHHDYYYANQTRTPMRNVHASHCVYTLLQNIQCQVDLDVVTYNWIGEEHRPFQDFNTMKQCRDFEAVLAWQRAHEVDGQLYLEITKPAEMTALPRPSCLIYDVFNVSAQPAQLPPGCT
jgi:hypothetical protein